MRNYRYIERYLNQLLDDVYPQPPDPGHQRAGEEIIHRWLSKLTGLKTIVDVGCGQGQFLKALSKYGYVEGVTLGTDFDIAKSCSFNVYNKDFTFLEFDDKSVDLVFARHVIEHSPMPLLTLMEWARVSKQWLLMIIPSLDIFGPGGQNHYYVLRNDQWRILLDRAGWKPIWEDISKDPVAETRWLCEKK